MSKLVESARTYLGVRWRHRGRSRASVDCGGLVWCAYNDLGVTLPDAKLYGRHPHEDGLIRHLTAALGEPLPDGAPYRDDDVIVLRFDIEPHHIAIVAAVEYAGIPAFNIIHADGHVGRVIEQRLMPDVAARITHVFRRAV